MKSESCQSRHNRTVCPQDPVDTRCALIGAALGIRIRQGRVATISQHLWACKAGLHQQIHGMSNSGPIRSRLPKLLQKISAKIRKYIVLRPEALIATALWTMTAWAHEGATHSPILAAISVEPDSGKSTLLGVLHFLVPKPFVSVEPTGPSVYRTVDREHPTLIIDEADDLFYRKSRWRWRR